MRTEAEAEETRRKAGRGQREGGGRRRVGGQSRLDEGPEAGAPGRGGVWQRKRRSRKWRGAPRGMRAAERGECGTETGMKGRAQGFRNRTHTGRSVQGVEM